MPCVVVVLTGENKHGFAGVSFHHWRGPLREKKGSSLRCRLLSLDTYYVYFAIQRVQEIIIIMTKGVIGIRVYLPLSLDSPQCLEVLHSGVNVLIVSSIV